MLLVGILAIVLGAWGCRQAKHGLQRAEKNVYARYEQAFVVLNTMFVRHHAEIYKDERAQQILFYHTDLFLSDMQNTQKVQTYATYQPGIYEDIRFLCSLVAKKSEFLDVIPPLPSKISTKKIQMRGYILLVGIGLFITLSNIPF